ncbi:MAG TPA: hypothetical protein VMF59_11755, partial [Bacteroidota bacterium]|nr:hypothetical protein [Bacteroidota bacterium]
MRLPSRRTLNAGLLLAGLLAMLVTVPAAGQNLVIINADLAKDTINRNIYGHFSEHLGRCIYGG